MDFFNNSYLTYQILPRIIGPSGIFRLNGNVYFTDILDILIIATFIYSIFYLFQKTRSFLILTGMVIVILLYAFAKIFNLYLTSIALQYFFGVSVVVFFIIFQHEIRKYFEMVGVMSTRRIKVKPLAVTSPTTNEIIQACVKMAQSKTGVLIVVQGKDNLDSFMEGGVPLDGVISEELLLSIFDPHSDGHDGAVVIINNRISKFGAHLPLSNNFKEIGKHGTRHGAALGITESSDAFCIVVSEEKGKISVCREGKLKTLENYSDIEKEFDKFIKDKFSTKQVNFIQQIIQKDLSLKSAAVASACLLWFISAYQAGIIKKTYTVPIEFENMPKDILIESYSPKEITLTASGRGDIAFDQISNSSFEVNINSVSIKNGVNKYNLTSADIKQPINLKITSIDPKSVLLSAKKYTPLTSPVTVQTHGQAAKGFTITNLTVTPEQIDLWLPEDATPPAEILTDIIDVTDKKESFVIPANLILPQGIKLQKVENSTANIAVTIEETNP